MILVCEHPCSLLQAVEENEYIKVNNNNYDYYGYDNDYYSNDTIANIYHLILKLSLLNALLQFIFFSLFLFFLKLTIHIDYHLIHIFSFFNARTADTKARTYRFPHTHGTSLFN